MIYVNEVGALLLSSPLIRPPEGRFYIQKGGGAGRATQPQSTRDELVGKSIQEVNTLCLYVLVFVFCFFLVGGGRGRYDFARRNSILFF